MMLMMMEAADHQDHEEAMMGYKDQAQMMIIKGKRTKRQKTGSPIGFNNTSAVAAVSSSSTAGHDHGGRAGPTEASPATSADQSPDFSTEEEEDMANCLILLAQGNSTKSKSQNPILVLNSTNKPSPSPSAAVGLDLYQCKTCDRCFPSFQALGGHRASHKKPGKANMNSSSITQDHKKALSFEAEEYDTSTTLSLQISHRAFRAVSSSATTTTTPYIHNHNHNHNNNKGNKIHECSVCGAEFTSGQALGGHMRRHRTFNPTTATATATATAAAGTSSMISSPQSQLGSKRPRNVLELDLNLPAPEEERIETKFPFASKKEQVIVFSASPLVGCHY